MRRIVVVGQMRGRPDYDRQAFLADAERFRSQGDAVRTLFDHPQVGELLRDPGHVPLPDDEELMTRVMLLNLQWATHLALRNTWESSDGARIEVKLGQWMRLGLLDAATGEEIAGTARVRPTWTLRPLLTEIAAYYTTRYPNDPFDPQKICNHLHSEVSEIWEDLRAGHSLDAVWTETDERGPKVRGIPIELADVILVALGFVVRSNAGIDIEQAIRTKFANNWERKAKRGAV